LLETTLILSTLGNRYLRDHCRRDIRVQRSQIPPSNEFRQIMSQFSIKLQETTLILSTLSTRYFRDPCRRDIRVQRPQKSLSSKTELISINIYRVANFLFIFFSNALLKCIFFMQKCIF
ncbi:hypothetical protein TSAR_017070, partial [Trichomalopsis sarcophagae]